MSTDKRDKWISRQAGDQISVIERSSLAPSTAGVTSDSPSELICSYNWTKDQRATILVPGSAALWVGGNLPKTVSPDSGRQFIDQDGSKVPKHPFESVFRALEVQNSDYRFDNIDCLVNRNSLRKLLDFCKGVKARNSFRLNLYAVQNTLIIERCEKSAVELLKGSGSSGYGHNFERAFTKYAKGLGDSTSHHRVLQYKLGDMEMAVRFEVDACLDIDAESDTNGTSASTRTSQRNLEQLSEGLNYLQLESNNLKAQKHKSSSVTVLQKGKGTAQSSTAEIKTAQKSVQMSKVRPQMWFGRTQHLIKGIHTDGSFDNVEIEIIDLENWEKDAKNQLALRKLSALLERLRDIVRSDSNNMDAAIVILHKHDASNLKVFARREAKLPLPQDVIAKFWRAN